MNSSTDVERALLGAIILNNNQYAEVEGVVSHKDFFLPDHQRIWLRMEATIPQGKTCDLVTLYRELPKQVKVLRELTVGVSSKGALGYAKTVRDQSLRRGLTRTASKILRDVEDLDKPIEEIIAGADEEMTGLTLGKSSDFSTMQQLGEQVIAQLELAAQTPDEIVGIPTGFAGLDSLTGGWQDTDLIILAARPSVGKSAFMMNSLAYAAIECKKSVAIFSLEMSGSQLYRRVASDVAEIDSRRMRESRLTKSEWESLTTAWGKLSESNLFIFDDPGMAIGEIRSQCRKLKKTQDLDIVGVDYLQLIEGKGENRNQEVAAIARSLKVMAKELRVPVLALSQINRAAERDNRLPRLSGLRDSGAIEQDADLVAFLHRDGADAKLILSKQRNGPLGEVPLKFLEEYTRFAESSYSMSF